MIIRTSVAAAVLASLAWASQPSAADPVAAPMRDLKWGQLNFLHTTDTHGWLGGHLQEPQYSADWGDYISFTHHMRKRADEEGIDLLVIDSGDRVEGNGLFDGSHPKGLFQYGIYAESDADLLCSGNHELYKAYSAFCEHNITVPNYKQNYIASNLDYIEPETGNRVPQAQRYRKFKTKNLGIEIVAFGFIFDFDGNANNTVVQPVAETIKEDWFQEAIREGPDLFVIVGHVGLRMEEFKTIYTAVRKQNWDTPIVFFGGHAHVRDARQFDSKAFAIASGRYFETIGWVSIDGIKASQDEAEVEATASPSFARRYIDTNLFGLHYHTGLNDTTFPTKHGKRVTETIARARKSLDLDYKFGCAPKTLWMNRAEYPGDDSIYSWITDEVFPDIITRKDRKDKSRLAITNTGGIRFDIFKGPFTRDATYTVSPFTSGFRYIPDVPYAAASKVIHILNSAGRIFKEHNLDTRLLTIPQQRYPVPVSTFDEPEDTEQTRLELRHLKKEPSLITGYTTRDDFGNDGDDTVHEAIKTYHSPNCIQGEINFPVGGEPETVDLVFLDFIQPWIIPALKFAGADYTDDDVELYMEGTLTYKLADWISQNWKGEC
ncbi:Metallo-dependent phosphatase-like protein [Dactylonectria estremocensis]|uniref:Metallo-dependent phosphatase-like protein n=1 Tax=Dactylonectria estremocensis TaxID=1079267 RepID=A0A9P9DW62_9HYPO|nr:Metallo-dependent phosphatase-like protein [Dactylonectria estremocensis]